MIHRPLSAQSQPWRFSFPKHRIPKGYGLGSRVYWVLVQGCSLSCYNKETVVFTIDPYIMTLNPKP